ncbi:cytochrome-c oxidase, cbb3-type subunit III [Methylosinus sp. Sm6]|uniref:cytochrome-c oxidase, cbb3-type subunit III n=1 Tax=Methylosinus sp. Sm6 TaxID=2866948 RepID=UPI001C9A01C0|nr:cytochrome-c oxidase, cbb3-type subunit III [Methylosinus sp. Sm6]MBY6242501.1 cytochrome-c oxidase, cbb3-type subunit III [Methylosinus sp. Sm6]
MSTNEMRETHVKTTGHEWDGIEELDTPLPRWWLITFYATILWSLAYFLVYPSLPTPSGATQGLLGWHSRTAVTQDLDELQKIRGPVMARLATATLEEIEKTPQLLSAARALGAAAFANNCAGCHGAGAQGAKGYPNLNDDEWLWGGRLADIRRTIEHGVRWDADKETRTETMPAFGRDGLLDAGQISLIADEVRALGKLPGAKPAAAGAKLFDDNCSVCHGVDGKGNRDMGAPNLTDALWLFGSDKATIVARIANGGGGVMPAWGNRLDDTTITALTVYVHSLGGGE